MRIRSPPQFVRTPSRRHQRRIVEGANDSSKIDETKSDRENMIPAQETKIVTIPQSAHSLSSVFRSTCSIPAALPSHNRSESPRSTRSVPWTQRGGLYNNPTSPRSVRSAGNTSHLLHRLTQRSSSVDSQSSNDSRSCKSGRHRRHRSRKGSDNESEQSKCSSRSHHRHRRRSHCKRESETDSHHHHRHRHRHKSNSSSTSRRHGSHYELVDSGAQWKEVQRQQAEGGTGVHQATVINNKDRRSGYMNSGMETESEMSFHHKRKQMKHRSRSRSPSEANKVRLPDELKKHLEFNLIDTEGMSDAQLREIPYTVIETNTKTHRNKHSPNSKRKHNTNRKSKSSKSESTNKMTTVTESPPPPPYSPTRDDNCLTDITNNGKSCLVTHSSGDSGNYSNTGAGSNSSSTSNSALADFLNKNTTPNHCGSGSSTHSPSGSVSARIHKYEDSSTIRNTSTNINHQRSSSNWNERSSNNNNNNTWNTSNKSYYTQLHMAQSSALYGNPSTMLGNNNNKSNMFSNKQYGNRSYQSNTYVPPLPVTPDVNNRIKHMNLVNTDRRLHENGLPHHYDWLRQEGASSRASSVRSEGHDRKKRNGTGPLYYQQSTTQIMSKQHESKNPGSEYKGKSFQDDKKRSASLELILSPIIRSRPNHQPTAVQ